MTIDEILAELPNLTFEELQVIIDRVNELKIERARDLAALPLTGEQKAEVEALLAETKAFRDSLNFTTTPEEIGRFKREGRL